MRIILIYMGAAMAVTTTFKEMDRFIKLQTQKLQ